MESRRNVGFFLICLVSDELRHWHRTGRNTMKGMCTHSVNAHGAEVLKYFILNLHCFLLFAEAECLQKMAKPVEAVILFVLKKHKID